MKSQTKILSSVPGISLFEPEFPISLPDDFSFLFFGGFLVHPLLTFKDLFLLSSLHSHPLSSPHRPLAFLFFSHYLHHLSDRDLLSPNRSSLDDQEVRLFDPLVACPLLLERHGMSRELRLYHARPGFELPALLGQSVDS